MALNFNIGVLGHIDSGKTSLAKVLSTTASTASFDKNPQSKERGITLDLGFSSFSVDLPKHLQSAGYERLQFTLVDCPGHASLIKTIIGGAQIIDLMMLVIDVTKGMQTQTAECLIIGEITCEKMIVVLNKTDLLPESKRQLMIEKMKKRMLKTLENTRFANAHIIAVSAKPGGSENDSEAVGINHLIEELKQLSFLPRRDACGPFLYAVDHCFSIRGQGTVMTGTILSGSVSVNDTVEIPSLQLTKKVKSMQMFRQPITSASQGDRLGLCVTQFDPKLLERGLVCTPNSLSTILAGIISVKRISYFKGKVATKAKLHVTMGHDTVMAKILFFGVSSDTKDTDFNFGREYFYQEQLHGEKDETDLAEAAGTTTHFPVCQWALLEFEKPVTCPLNCLVIGSKLDTDIHQNTCRLAFHGKLLHAITDKKYKETVLPRIKIYKDKVKEGIVERMTDEYTVIGRSLFKKETNIQLFVGFKVHLSTGEEGLIEGSFGQSGKFKVRIPGGIKAESGIVSGKKKGGKGKSAATSQEEKDEGGDQRAVKITLKFKRYIYDTDKKMIQT